MLKKACFFMFFDTPISTHHVILVKLVLLLFVSLIFSRDQDKPRNLIKPTKIRGGFVPQECPASTSTEILGASDVPWFL